MWRFVAVLVLAIAGIVWFIAFAGLMQQCALVSAFGTAVILPAVLTPTRNWARSFLVCLDMVYSTACLGAWFGALVVDPVSRIEVFTAGVVPALLFGTMASLGVGRSWLADVDRLRR
jgi:hypothetical protein